MKTKEHQAWMREIALLQTNYLGEILETLTMIEGNFTRGVGPKTRMKLKTNYYKLKTDNQRYYIWKQL